MKTIGIFMLAFMLAMSTTAQRSTKPFPTTYVLVFGHDDRLLIKGQYEQDSALVATFLTSFVQRIRQVEILQRKSMFVVVLPDQVASTDLVSMTDSLTLDLGAMPVSQRHQALKTFQTRFPYRFKALYQAATQGRRKKSEYAGINVWKCFQDRTDVFGRKNGVVLLLDDGYCDFEKKSASRTLTQGNRSTTTNFLPVLRRAGTNFKELLPDYGLLSLPKQYPDLAVFMGEVRPEKNSCVMEADILTAVWTDFWHRAGIKSDRFHLQLTGNPALSQRALREFLANNQRLKSTTL